MARTYGENNEYSTQNNVFGGAAANGQTGSQTPASQTNAASQQQKQPADPFASFGNAAQQWGQLLKGFQQGPSQPGGAGGEGPLKTPPWFVQQGPSPIGAKQPAAPMIGVPQSPMGVKKPSLPSGEGQEAPPPSVGNTPPGAWANPIPKPADPNDLEGMAAWYRGFADDPLNGDPSYATITAADVNNYRALAVSGQINMNIGDWAKAGKPGGQWTPGAPPPTTGSVPTQTGGSTETQPVDRSGVPGVAAGGVPQGVAGRTPGAPPTSADGSGANGGGDMASLLDYYKQLMGPLHQQEQEDYLRQLATADANSGAINSGAHGEAQSRGLADLINNENAGIYSNLFTGSESAKDRALQKALAEITGNYGLQSAQIGASAAGASAAASSGAEKYKADLAYKQFQDELPYQDKWHGYNFQLGEDQLSGQQFQYLLSLMGGLNFPPSNMLPQLPQGGFF